VYDEVTARPTCTDSRCVGHCHQQAGGRGWELKVRVKVGQPSRVAGVGCKCLLVVE